MSIEFYSTFKGTRPERTCEKTRKFAYDSLNAMYGRKTHEFPSVAADKIEGYSEMSPLDKYDNAIKLIAAEAPIQICPDELLCGSATLEAAIGHSVPVTYEGKIIQASVSHLTCNFDRVVREGVDSFRKRIDKRMEKDMTEDEKNILKSLINVYDSFKIWHGRYIDELKRLIDDSDEIENKKYYTELYENLEHVPFKAPENFRQAIQSVWFTFAFIRLCGNWPGVGRIDIMLGKYLDDDLKSGKITIDEARELIAHFWIKGCEWIRLNLDARGSGDSQHYQNIVLAGCDEHGNEIANEVTRLVLEVVEEFPIPDFPIAVRLNENSPEWLTRKMADVIRHGGGVVAAYNENLIIQSLVDFGYDLTEARQFANDGCWEVQIPGKTLFSYSAMDIYGLYQNKVLGMNSGETISYNSFEEMYDAFRKAMNEMIDGWHKGADNFGHNEFPSSVIAFFEDDCIENARGYYNGGTRYRALSPHLGGVPDVANSMYAINKLVFEEKKISFADFMNILKEGWNNHEELRQYVANSYLYYGNDNDEVDGIAVAIMDDFMDYTRLVKCRNDVLRPPGISTFGRQIDWKDIRANHAHGFSRGDILASNISPTPGTDKIGATAVIRSHCKIDFSKLTCGTALDIKLEPNSVKDEDGLEAIESLLRGFIDLGGFFIQIDVLDNEILLEAQKHPEKYQNLAVRISGWSARFVTLNDEWQRMIIERTSMQR